MKYSENEKIEFKRIMNLDSLYVLKLENTELKYDNKKLKGNINSMQENIWRLERRVAELRAEINDTKSSKPVPCWSESKLSRVLKIIRE